VFRTSCSLVLVAALSASTAVAGPLGSDPNGIPEYTGSVSFNADDTLLVDLDYAVYAPGDYPDDGVNGQDPSDGAEYVYAYQAYNVSSSASLTTVTVGLTDGALANNPMGDPLHVEVGGAAPTFSVVQPTSVLSNFSTPPVGPGDFSSVFLYTSPYEPTFFATSVIGGGIADQQLAPSPLPEPSCLGLLIVGLAAATGRRRRRA
jgi:hypothetical protein